MDMLDWRNSSQVLGRTYDLLAPGGRPVFYESNLRGTRSCAPRRSARLVGRWTRGPC